MTSTTPADLDGFDAETRVDDEAGLTCPECGAEALYEDERRGEVVCAACGLVDSENAIDPGPEWRAFDADQRNERSRAGPGRTVMRHDRGLGTKIGHQENASLQDRARLSRMRRYQQRATYQPGADRGLAYALTEIKRIGNALDLPDETTETAVQIYRQAREAEFVHGRKIETVAATSVLVAARMQGTPRRLDEIAEASEPGRDQVGATFRKLHRDLELAVPLTAPQDLVAAIASQLDVPGEVERAALDLLDRADGKSLSGKSPASLAAAAIYRAAKQTGHHRNQEMVGEAADVSAVTVRNRLEDLPAEIAA